MTTTATMGHAIVIVRTARQLTRKGLAEQASISYPYICEIEKGEKDPSFAVFTRICKALSISPADLMHFCEQVALNGDLTIPKAQP